MSKVFDWKEFLNKRNNIAVHCKTKSEAEEFCKEMDAHGLKWCDRTSYIGNLEWNSYKESTCYTNGGEYCCLDYFKRERVWTILEWSDYANEFRVETVEEFIQRTRRNVEF